MIARTTLIAAALAVSSMPAGASPERGLPAGVKWGRCLLVVKGETRISGKCSYHIGKGGDFRIDGPRQIFEGIDYPVSDTMAGKMSKDYWARIFRDGDGWTGYGNSVIESVHGDGDWGALRREGACYIGQAARICLWRS